MNSTVYSYKDENGNVLYEKVRNIGKLFYFRRPDVNGFKTGLNGQTKVLYNLPAVIAAQRRTTDEYIFICEGEKDADSLVSLGFTATTAGGAGDWRIEFAQYFTNMNVIVCEDNDLRGRESAARICRDLSGITTSIRLLTFRDMPEKFDISDWLAEGGNRESLLGMLKSLPPMKPDTKTCPIHTSKADTVKRISENDFQRLGRMFFPPEIPNDILCKCSDSTNGELLAFLHGEHIRYDHCRKRWLVWNSHWWEEDKTGELNRRALDSARTRFHAAGRQIFDPDKKKKVAKYAVRSEDRNKISACLDMAKNLPPIADAGDDWDADPWLFGVSNGIIDLHDGVLRPGTPEVRVSVHSPIVYDAAAECPRWNQFLSEVFEENACLIEFISRAVGYSLTGFTSEQCFFVLEGTGCNGKGVFTETLRTVLGQYGFDAGFEAFSKNETHPEALANLAGKRFVTVSEVRENVNINEQRIKVLCHGDTISARALYGSRFEFKPQCKLWLSLNRRPRISDDSFGFWRSVRIIRFPRQFDKDADPALLTTLRAEAPGILAWAVKACLSWQEKGLDAPKEVITETQAWQAESDPLADFLDTCTVEIEGYTPGSEIWNAYIQYCDNNSTPEKQRVTQRYFGLRLGERHRKERKNISGKTHICYTGIGVLHE